MQDETLDTTVESYNVFDEIRSYDRYFRDEDVEILEGYNFNQQERVKANHLYYASQFQTASGDDRRFYNITKSSCKNESKNIDLDVKDINVIPISKGAATKAWLLRRDVTVFSKKRKLGLLFNEFTDKLPIYGSVVGKKTGDDNIFARVNLMNLENDPTAESLNSSWIIENHWYRPSELRKKKAVWDKTLIERAIKSFRQTGKENYTEDTKATDQCGNSQFIHVVEFIDDVPESAIYENKSDDKYIRAKFIVVMSENKSGDGLILDKTEIKEDEYKECHRDRIDGRWLGVGIPEDLEEAQILKNEEINYMRDALKLSSMILLQSTDQKIARNILSDLMNGDILKVRQEIKEVPLNVRNLGEKQQITAELDRLITSLANTPEITTGQTLPSGTPFRLGDLMNQNANKLFDYIREKLGLFYKEIFEDWVAPELKKDWDKEHILRVTDQRELKLLAKEMSKAKTWEAIKKFIAESGREPNAQEIALVEQLVSERYLNSELLLEIPKEFYSLDDVEFEFTGESVDKDTKLKTLASLMQIVGSNLTMLENPIIQEILNLTGFNYIDFGSVDQGQSMQPQAQMQAGQAQAGNQPLMAQ